MSGAQSSFGVAKETTWGTAVAATKGFEIIKEDLRGLYTRVESEGIGGDLVARKDRFQPVGKGAAGSVELEVLTKGFGFWLEQMLGAVATTGPTETTVYTHTGTVASLTGKSFTAQAQRADTSGTKQPFTYEGGKVVGFEFNNAVDQSLRCKIDMDFEKESWPTSPAGVYALQTQVLPTGAEFFTWAGGQITYNSVAIEVMDCSVKVDNALKVDRYSINSSAAKQQQTQDGKRKIEFSATIPFADRTLYDRIAAATAAGSYAALNLKWLGPTLLGTTIFPTLEIQVPFARLDEGIPVIESASMLTQPVAGVGLTDGSSSPITIVYKTADSTP